MIFKGFDRALFRKTIKNMYKKLLISFFFFSILVTYAQQTYYNGIDFTKSGIALKNDLATLISNTHTKTLSYSQAREALKIIDLEPNQASNVLLLYGFSNNMCPTNSSDDNDHRLRSKSNSGGGATCEWNREHTYPKSLGNPNLRTSGPGADVHHLRACDVQRNGNRGSKKFAAGSGNSGNSAGGWYPGNEWKGDVARMMMYMYLRYGSQCLPTAVGIGSSSSTPDDMIDLFLQWNVNDPVSDYEKSRNTYLEDTNNTYGQGNRNPFIDNPFLATKIWGGNAAEDIWGTLATTDSFKTSFKIYPNPASGNTLYFTVDKNVTIKIYSILGKLIVDKTISINNNKIDISKINKGIYIIKISSNKQTTTNKFVRK